jgi:hypothetical protein
MSKRITRKKLNMETKPKKPKLKNGVVRFRCNLQEKAQWVRQSRREGKTLSQWIIEQLNKY